METPEENAGAGLPSGRRRLRVLHVAMELAPWAKVGGLADVLAGLPGAQAAQGDEVEVVIPYHTCADWPENQIRPLPNGAFTLDLGGLEVRVELLLLHHPGGFRVILVRNPDLYDRHGIYHEPHSADRFGDALIRRSTLCHAALRYALLDGRPWDVIHAHDAAGALTVPLAHYRFRETALGRARRVFTVHNLGYLESHPLDSLHFAGLPREDAYPGGPLEFWGGFSALKAALIYADRILTVSPTYAREVLEDPAIGGPMQGVVQSRREVWTGILNGIDRKTWNPAADPHLVAGFDARDFGGREACRRELRELAALEPRRAGEPEVVVVGVVSRLVHQKGLDMLAESIPSLVRQGLRFAVVGTGEPDLEDRFSALACEHPGGVWTSLDSREPVARKVFAGSDLFCVPSLYEPCGLTQQYALLYGSTPVVRRTGGLADTVDQEVGFLFDPPRADELARTLKEGAEAVRNKARHRPMQVAGMGRGRSWESVADEIRGRVYLDGAARPNP